MDVLELAAGIARDLATAALAVGLVACAVVFVTRRPAAVARRVEPRALAAPAGTVELAKARAAARRSEDPRPQLDAAPVTGAADTGPSSAQAEALAVHLADTNPALLAEVISAWLRDDADDRA